MPNSDGGWAAFDLNNNMLYLNEVPYSDMDSLCDPSTADVTGRILGAFGLMTHAARQEHIAPDLLNRIIAASERAIAYLAKTQEPTGACYGRWGMNYVDCTSSALCGLAHFSQDDQLVQDMVTSAILWLKMTQNPDGGWGEGPESYKDPMRCGCGPSTASQTAWAVMGLLTYRFPTDEATKKGVAYLVHSQTDTAGDGASWPETKYTGTGFPNHFYLGYTLYRHYFPMMALGRYVEAMRSVDEKQSMSFTYRRQEDEGEKQ